jgi:hypothetical protein
MFRTRTNETGFGPNVARLTSGERIPAEIDAPGRRPSPNPSGSTL